VYDGLWFGALRNALAAFVSSTQEHVTGDVRVRCARGGVTVTGRRAQRSLYSTSLATYDREGDLFDHGAARGFIELFGLSLRTQARVQGALEDLAPLSLPRQVRRAP
jgi:argininosuccinate synthase